MNSRWYAIAIALVAGASLWWALARKPLVPAATERAASPVASSSQTKPLVASEHSETKATGEAPDASRSSALPGPVEPKPKPIVLATAESAPSGPEMGEPGSGLTPATVLENLRSAVRQYHLRFGANPVGDNSEITASLSGRNSRQATFVSVDDGLRINDRGELIDNWGTPFFFHQLSRTEMEIHSAGPDRKMWSQDDLVLK